MVESDEEAFFLLGETLKAEASILQSALNKHLPERDIDSDYWNEDEFVSEMANYWRPANRTYELATKLLEFEAEKQDERSTVFGRPDWQDEIEVGRSTEPKWRYDGEENLSAALEAELQHEDARERADDIGIDPYDFLRQAMNDYEGLVDTAEHVYGVHIPIERAGYRQVEDEGEILSEKGFIIDQ